MYRCITHEIVSQFQTVEVSVASVCVVKECKGIKLEKKKKKDTHSNATGSRTASLARQTTRSLHEGSSGEHI